MNNIKIVGTTHLQSKESIIEEIKDFNPDIVGIELCSIRAYIYLNKIKPVDDNKDKSILGKISDAIKKKAEENKEEYGSDMYTALEYSIENKIPYALVDKNINELQQLFLKIPENEQKGFMTELTKFESQTLAQSTSINEDEFLAELKKNYPISFEFLITLREQYIAIQILKLLREHPEKQILIFLGKGHINSINKILDLK